MIRRLTLTFSIALSTCTFVCADSKENTTLGSSDGQYQLALPKGWQSADFHVEAVQIGALSKHTGEYVEVIVENIADYTDSLSQYADAKRDTMALSVDNPRLTPGESLRVNGIPAARFELHGQLPATDVSVGYVLTVLKTKTHYVQVIGWTKESRFAANHADLQQLAADFSETGASQQ